MNIDDAIKNALNGDAILFLGSGASIGTPNIGGNTMLNCSELAKKIYPGTTDIQQATELFIDDQNEKGNDAEHALIDVLKKEFRCKEILPEHREIVGLNWKRLYTTNYDDIIETAYKENAITVKSATLSSNIKDYIANNELVILHINGSINNLVASKLNDEFKLSSYSYNTDQFTSSQWGALFRNDLSSYSTTVFIGFSMNYDLDIRRIVNTISKDKCVFIVSENEANANIKTLRKYGDVYPIGITGFANRIKEIKKTYVPSTSRVLYSYTNFELIKSPHPLSIATDAQVLQYYCAGIRSDELYFGEIGHYKSVVSRDYVRHIIADIESGIKAVFIHSDIGNGKTEVIEQICKELPNTYLKYRLIDNNIKINMEIENLCNNGKKTIIVIENFFDYFDVFKKFCMYSCNDNLVFIFSARTSIYKSRLDTFNIEPNTVYDLNRLTVKEMSQMELILSTYGFYPPENNISLHTFIRKNCNKRLQSLLLSIMNNITITDRLWTVCEKMLDSEYKYYKLILFLIVIKLMSLNLNLNDILDLLGVYFLDLQFDRDGDMNEIIDRNNDNISIKSSILCLWILKKKKCIDDIISLLIETSKRADCGFMANHKYAKYLINLISYKHLKFVLDAASLNKEQKIDKINQLYGELKELNYYKDKYYFWLQYAISALELNDYEAAELHFRAAYHYLPSQMTPFEINNQYARLKMELLLKEDYLYNEKETIREVEKIDELLTPTKSSKDEEYYCYSMASSYYSRIFSKFYAGMNFDEKQKMRSIAKKNFNGCSYYLRFNTNTSFNSYLKSFVKIFGELAFYDDILDFTITAIKHIKRSRSKLIMGYVFIGETRRDACIKNMKCQTCKVGDTIKVRIKEYDSIHNKYVLGVVE